MDRLAVGTNDIGLAEQTDRDPEQPVEAVNSGRVVGQTGLGPDAAR
jgi:hypothetical protein